MTGHGRDQRAGPLVPEGRLRAGEVWLLTPASPTLLGRPSLWLLAREVRPNVWLEMLLDPDPNDDDALTLIEHDHTGDAPSWRWRRQA